MNRKLTTIILVSALVMPSISQAAFCYGRRPAEQAACLQRAQIRLQQQQLREQQLERKQRQRAIDNRRFRNGYSTCLGARCGGSMWRGWR